MLSDLLRDAQRRTNVAGPIVTADAIARALTDIHFTGPVTVHFKDGRPIAYVFHPALQVNIKREI